MKFSIHKVRLILFALIGFASSLHANITFGSHQSSIELLNGATLNVLSSTLSLTEGRLKRSASALFSNTNPVIMNNCIYVDGTVDTLMSGQIGQTTASFPIRLNGLGSELRLEPGVLLLDVVVQGSGARIAGQPNLVRPQQITLESASTYVDIDLQGALNQSINMNGGTLNLLEDLELAQNVVLNGGGTIKCNGNKVIIKGTSLGRITAIPNITPFVWPSNSYVWENRPVIELKSNVRLSGDWTLSNGTRIIGNGNILDLTNGSLTLPAGATVSISNLMIEGFVTTVPKINFGNASQLRIDRVDLALQSGVGATTVNLTNGGIYVEGESTVLGRGRRIGFTLAATLTVDGVALIGDALSSTVPFPIRPGVVGDPANPGPAGNRRNVNTYNKGIIRTPGGGSSGPSIIDNSVTNIGSIEINVNNQLTFTQSTIYNGDFTTLSFATANQTLVNVANNVAAETRNITLRNFELNYINLGTGSSFIFGDGTTLVLAQSSVSGFPCETLVRTYTFRGSVAIDGNNHCWDMTNTRANLVIMPSSVLAIQNLTIKNFGLNQIRCMHGSSVLALRNVTLILDSNYSFTTGSLWVHAGLTDVQGSFTFAYTTSNASFIFNQGTLRFSAGSTFLYNPTVNNRDLIVFEDSTAVLGLFNGTLASTRTGIRLTVGSLNVEGAGFLTQNTAKTLALSEGIAFGNGNPSNEITITIGAGAVLEMLAGRLVYDHNT